MLTNINYFTYCGGVAIVFKSGVDVLLFKLSLSSLLGFDESKCDLS